MSVPGPEQLHPLRQAAAGGDQADPRHRPLRGRAADPLPHQRGDLAVADLPRPRQPGRGGGHLRHEAGGRVRHAGAVRRGGHRRGRGADGPAGAVQLHDLRRPDWPTDGATLLVDIGADKTDLVVADGPRIWTRTIQHRRQQLHRGPGQGLQAVASPRPRSSSGPPPPASTPGRSSRPCGRSSPTWCRRSSGRIGLLHQPAPREPLQEVLGLGNGFRLPGLQKFLEQNLNIPVVRLDSVQHACSPRPDRQRPDVHRERAVASRWPTAWRLQGLGADAGRHQPAARGDLRRRRGSRKRPWFAAAGVLLAVASLCLAGRGITDYNNVAPDSADYLAAKSIQEKYQPPGAALHGAGVQRAFQGRPGHRRVCPAGLPRLLAGHAEGPQPGHPRHPARPATHRRQPAERRAWPRWAPSRANGCGSSS